MNSMYKYFLCFVAVMFLGVTTQARAQDDIHVGNDGPVIITLAEDAASVIVGNPLNAHIVMDTPRRLMVNAGAPGTTRLTVLNQAGKTIFNRDLVIGAGGGGMIRVQNACINADGGACTPDVTYKCKPGQRCNRVLPSQPPSGELYEVQGFAPVPPTDISEIQEE